MTMAFPWRFPRVNSRRDVQGRDMGQGEVEVKWRWAGVASAFLPSRFDSCALLAAAENLLRIAYAGQQKFCFRQRQLTPAHPLHIPPEPVQLTADPRYPSA